MAIIPSLRGICSNYTIGQRRSFPFSFRRQQFLTHQKTLVDVWVQGAVKNIKPAVASAYTVIAAAYGNEMFIIAFHCYECMSSCRNFNDLNDVYRYSNAGEQD
ncbi:hypothetical protein GQX74_013470 [Glossina fuscipes]|nr:hypothetical protein GQX74_013470 [Glossina fuscipes]